MAYGREIYAGAEKILQERRKNAQDDAQRRKESLYRLCPEARELERRLTGTAAAAARAVLSGKDVREELERLKAGNEALLEKLSALMRAHGIETLEPQYYCPLCHDTGYVNGKMCSCLKKLLRTESYRRLNGLTPLSLSTFESFSLDYYSDAPREGKPPDREIMRNAFRYCVSYAENFSLRSPNLILTGGTGLGKTHLSLAIANEAIQKGFGVVYCSVGSLVSKLEDEHFGRETQGGTTDSLRDCDLLILDDLGTEFRSSFSCAAIYGIVNTRLLEQKPTLISTNLSTKEMVECYSERFASRIIGSYRRIAFAGRDIRQQRRETGRQVK